ncbi:TetR/AcrR family transcriptional regulator [Haladaptatus sp. DYF46]|uniref:TetR/AcrR family transcriptional regulator n=1 Tax=Haladaptatus sp. DYF46 TaxID=2886041 RepID=UPI001E5093A4|nr:TetR/AcrR family transcriptional regulator [Haladaptatus sp. DYF46]
MKGFSDDERDRIRRLLLDDGRDLFERYGLKKTTIADLTDAAGIADSTFYRFFDSKEELYFEILQREGHALADELVNESLASEDDPGRAIATFMRLLVDTIEENRLMRRLLVEDEFMEVMQVVSDVSPEEFEERRAESLAYVLPYIEAWQETGDVRAGNPETIAGVMGTVKLLPLYRDQIGRDYYEAVRDMFIEIVAAGLTQTGE